MAKLDDTEINRIVQNEIDDAVLYQQEEYGDRLNTGAPHPHRLLKLWRCGEGNPPSLNQIHRLRLVASNARLLYRHP